jgi:hypothetical protein
MVARRFNPDNNYPIKKTLDLTLRRERMDQDLSLSALPKVPKVPPTRLYALDPLEDRFASFNPNSICYTSVREFEITDRPEQRVDQPDE